MLSNRLGSFGQFRRAESDEGPQSVANNGSSLGPSMTIPAGESLDVNVTAVCLNYGLPTPTLRDRFTLMDVDDYSTDNRVRRSLRSLCRIGTSQGVAQAVMWRVCNDLTFEAMAAQASKVINEYEIALAARFIGVLDETADAVLVDPRALSENRMFVKIQGEGALISEAERLSRQVESCRLLGLAAQAVDDDQPPSAPAALFINVVLSDSKHGDTQGRIMVSYSLTADQWVPLGKATFRDTSSVSMLDGKALAQIIDRAIGASFVTVKLRGGL